MRELLKNIPKSTMIYFKKLHHIQKKLHTKLNFYTKSIFFFIKSEKILLETLKFLLQIRSILHKTDATKLH